MKLCNVIRHKLKQGLLPFVSLFACVGITACNVPDNLIELSWHNYDKYIEEIPMSADSSFGTASEVVIMRTKSKQKHSYFKECELSTTVFYRHGFDSAMQKSRECKARIDSKGNCTLLFVFNAKISPEEQKEFYFNKISAERWLFYEDGGTCHFYTDLSYRCEEQAVYMTQDNFMEYIDVDIRMKANEIMESKKGDLFPCVIITPKCEGVVFEECYVSIFLNIRHSKVDATIHTLESRLTSDGFAELIFESKQSSEWPYIEVWLSDYIYFRNIQVPATYWAVHY